MEIIKKKCSHMRDKFCSMMSELQMFHRIFFFFFLIFSSIVITIIMILLLKQKKSRNDGMINRISTRTDQQRAKFNYCHFMLHSIMLIHLKCNFVGCRKKENEMTVKCKLYIIVHNGISANNLRNRISQILLRKCANKKM